MGTVIDIDGNSYNTVVIGNQEWMTRNLATTKYVDNSSIPNLIVDGDWQSDTIGAYRWYNNDIANKAIYGALYNWHSVNNASGLAPTGWRVATKKDIDTLAAFAHDTWSAPAWALLGGLLKETGIAHWHNPNIGASDQYGMKIVPCGEVDFTGGFFQGHGEMAPVSWLWLSDVIAPNAKFWSIDNAMTTVEIGNQDRGYGMGVRCVRDYTSNQCDTSGNAPLYRFYVAIGSSSVEMHPLNFRETSLIDSFEADQQFYRRSFSGTLTFTNLSGDFDLLYASHEIDPCTKIFISIKKGSNFYWYGSFSTTDGKFDIDRCTFEIIPKTEDDYTDILDNADIQYNILSGLTEVTARAIQGVIDVTFTRNRWLIDVIEFIASQIIPTTTISSEFFTNATNPATLANNNLTLLTIAQKSDIKRPTSSDPATQALLSWNQLTEILWSMFQVAWNYDAVTNVINVEHISWFTSSPGMDLRTQLLCKATNKFSYLKESMPKYEKFAFMEANNVNFKGVQIYYNSNCVNTNPKSNIKETAIQVTTDLEYIINNPNSISDEGFVILCNYESGGNYFVKLNSGAYQHTDVRLNMDLSWANLHDRFFRHNRVLPEGILNGHLIDFWSAQKNIKQDDFYAQICDADNYDPANEITTELGEVYLNGAKASVKQSELRSSGETKFSLVYGPLGITQTPVADSKWILIWEDGCGVFHAILSEPADDDLNILIRFVIFDSGSAHVCDNGAGVTWTIPVTSTTDDFTLPAGSCDTGDIPAGGCIFYFPTTWEIISRPDWNVSYIKDSDCDCF